MPISIIIKGDLSMKKNLELIGKLSLAAGIISIILAIPFVGSILNFFNVLRIALLVLSILILVKIKGTNQPKNAAVLSIIANILGMIGSFIVFSTTTAATTAALADYASDADAAATALGGAIGGGIIGSLFSFPAWILLILAAIFFMINSGKAKQAALEVNETTIVEEEATIAE